MAPFDRQLEPSCDREVAVNYRCSARHTPLHALASARLSAADSIPVVVDDNRARCIASWPGGDEVYGVQAAQAQRLRT